MRVVGCLYVCFRICYTDAVGVQEDQYPPNIAVKVNQSYCHVPVSGEEKTISVLPVIRVL